MAAERERSASARARLLAAVSVLVVVGCTATPPTTPPPVTASASPPSMPATPSPSGAAASPAATPIVTDAPAAPPPPTGKPNAGTWTPAGSFDLGDLSGPAVVIRDDRVLALGFRGDSFDPEALLWSPAARDWQPTSPLPAYRSQAAIVALRDGSALVAGGFNGRKASYSSAYRFDPALEAWSKTGLMHTARAAPAAAVLPDGRVLVAGGYYYVPPDGEAGTSTVQLAVARPGGTPPPIRLDDVDVPPHGYALATAEVFDPSTGTWSETGPMRFARVGATAVTLSDGRVLVVGSSAEEVERVDPRAYDNAEVYDPATGRFTLAGRLPPIDQVALNEPGKNPVPDEDPRPDAVGALVALRDGGALLVGHGGWWKHVGEISRSFRLAPDLRTWQERGATWLVVGEPTANVLYGPARLDPSTAAVTGLTGDRVLAAGGSELDRSSRGWSTDASTMTTLFDGQRDRWLKAPALPEPIDRALAVTLSDGSALVVGGWGPFSRGSADRAAACFLYVPQGP